jgi:hypothetical protein
VLHLIYCYAECRYAECHDYAEGCYTECRYADCPGALALLSRFVATQARKFFYKFIFCVDIINSNAVNAVNSAALQLLERV